MTAAMEEKCADISTSYDCKGVIKLDGARKHCWKYGGHGTLRLEDAMANSCNIFFYNIGSKLGIGALSKWARNFGLGSKTGIRLPQEFQGLVPDKAWKKRVYRKDPTWWPGETLSVVIGQGSLIVTPIQIACLISTVANNGICYQPRILKKFIDPQTQLIKEFEPGLLRKVNIHKNNLKILQSSLKKVVEEGTAKGCKPDWIQVAGKTSTVQTASRKTTISAVDKKNKTLMNHAWLATYGGLNIKNPEVSAVIFIEHGGKKGAQAKIKIIRNIYSLIYPEPEESENEQNLLSRS